MSAQCGEKNHKHHVVVSVKDFTLFTSNKHAATAIFESKKNRYAQPSTLKFVK